MNWSQWTLDSIGLNCELLGTLHWARCVAGSRPEDEFFFWPNSSMQAGKIIHTGKKKHTTAPIIFFSYFRIVSGGCQRKSLNPDKFRRFGVLIGLGA